MLSAYKTYRASNHHLNHLFSNAFASGTVSGVSLGNKFSSRIPEWHRRRSRLQKIWFVRDRWGSRQQRELVGGATPCGCVGGRFIGKWLTCRYELTVNATAYSSRVGHSLKVSAVTGLAPLVGSFAFDAQYDEASVLVPSDVRSGPEHLLI